MPKSKDETFAEFERLGESVVQEKHGLGTYAGDRKKLAEEWLRQKDHARADAAERRNTDSMSEQIRIARSAKNAAWTAAIAAIIAAVIAIVSALIAYLALAHV